MFSLYFSLVALEQLKVILGQLLHETFVRFHFGYEPTQHSQAVLQLMFLALNHVSEDKSGCPAAAVDRMNENAPALGDAPSNESVGDAEVFANFFVGRVLDGQVQVLEVVVARRVGFATDVEDVSNAKIDELLRFEGRLERPHVDSFVNFH
jgi:hypothetical protein